MEKVFRVLLKRNAACLSCGDEPRLCFRAKFYLNCHSAVTSNHYLTIQEQSRCLFASCGRTASVTAKALYRRAQVLFAEVCIPRAHLDCLVSCELLDHFHVFAAHGEPGTERVPVIVPAIAYNLRICHRRCKPVARTVEKEDPAVGRRRLSIS